jgi:PII-like signaling protein
VATSVVLRGVAGFGPRHHLRTDESLSLSEDPPIVVAAVDIEPKMVGLAEEAIAMTPRGLLTLERAGGTDARIPETAKLTVYLGRQDRVAGRPAHHVLCALLRRHGFDCATVFLGVDGTARGQRHRAQFFSRNTNVPVMVIAVASGERVAQAIPEIATTIPDPLITIERVQLCKHAGRLLTRPAALPATDRDGRALWQKLMIHTSETTLHNGAPIHRSLVRRLRESPAVGGATVLRGIWGFRGDQQPHGDKPIQFGRHVPVTTVIVDSPERIARSFEIVDELTAEHGVVTSELVPALVSIDGGRHGDTALANYTY